MSAEYFIAYYGVRIELREDEIEPMERRKHPVVTAARKNHLKYYWDDFAAPEEKYLLFVGDELGVLGWEASQDRVMISRDELTRRMAETEAKLRSAGFDQIPGLHLQWGPPA